MSPKTKIVAALLVVIVIGMACWWLSHAHTEAEDANSTKNSAVTAAVARVERGTLENSLAIAGAFKPFQEVDVHAKVAGYIHSIPVDVGDHVREGQTLAVLEIPELAAELAGTDASVRRAQQEIHRAQGDMQRAESAHGAAHAMSDRLTQAAKQKPGLVAQQEVDDAHAKDMEAEAQVSSTQAALNAAQQSLEMAEANHTQYMALSSYARITAPFNGVITARYADTGALIAAGTTSTAQSAPVVKIAEVAKLRLVLAIPESLATQIHLGDSVKVHVSALDKDIIGKVSRFAGALDQQTRTMETEIDFPNKDDKLYPGMYAETVLQLAQRHDALLVPLEALAQSAGDTTALVVNAQNVVEERKVQLGLQGKTRGEVLSGLSAGDRVIIGNRSQYRSGEKVVPQDAKLPDMEKAGVN
jgi:RND family efflux transporter MFP subunit